MGSSGTCVVETEGSVPDDVFSHCKRAKNPPFWRCPGSDEKGARAWEMVYSILMVVRTHRHVQIVRFAIRYGIMNLFADSS